MSDSHRLSAESGICKPFQSVPALVFSPPPNPDCSASERQKSLESHAIVGPEPIISPELTAPQDALSNAKPRMSSRHSKIDSSKTWLRCLTSRLPDKIRIEMREVCESIVISQLYLQKHQTMICWRIYCTPLRLVLISLAYRLAMT